MELALKDSSNILTISDAIFNCNFNEPLVHQVIIAYAIGARQGTKSQKTSSEISGSGKKPWRQKGTGRARSGSVKSPIWRSGRVSFAARPKKYTQKVNKKMYKGALKCILSELIRQNRLIAVEEFLLDQPKTKILVLKLKDICLERILIVDHNINDNLRLAARNLHKVIICNTSTLDPISLIISDRVLLTVKAIKQIEEYLIQ